MANESLEARYLHLCNTPSDINGHLPTLRKYAEDSDLVVEFGTRNCLSATALAVGAREKLISIDNLSNTCHPTSYLTDAIAAFYKVAGNKFEFRLTDSRSPDAFESCDLLFIDSFHSYGQLKAELAVHGNKVKKYLIFHDTVTFGRVGEDGSEGLNKAIDEFLAANPHWLLLERLENNNGLTVLTRK